MTCWCHVPSEQLEEKILMANIHSSDLLQDTMSNVLSIYGYVRSMDHHIELALCLVQQSCVVYFGLDIVQAALDDVFSAH